MRALALNLWNGLNSAKPVPFSMTGRRDAWTAAALGAAVFVLFAPFALRGVDLHHDGLMFKTALDSARGKMLFNETFAQYGAFTSWLQAALLRLFGEQLRVLKLAAVGCYALTASLYYLIWRRELSLPRPVALAAVGVWSLFAYFFDPDWSMLPWSSAFALVIQALVFSAVARERALLTGLLCGVGYLFRQPVGVAMLGGALMCFALLSSPRTWARRLRQSGLLLTGFAAVMGAFLLREAWIGAWDQWLLQNWTFPRMMADRLGSYRQFGRKLFWDGSLGYPLLLLVPAIGWVFARARLSTRRVMAVATALIVLELTLFALAPEVLGFMMTPGGWRVFIPISLALLALSLVPHWYRHARTLDRETRIVLAFTVLGLCSWSQYFPIPCKRHVFWGISPAIGLFAYWLFRASERSVSRTLAWLLVLFLPALLGDARLARTKLWDREYELVEEGPLRGMRIDLSSREGPRLQRIHRLLREAAREHPEVPVLLETPNALYATLVPNQDQPGPIFVQWPDLRKTVFEDPAREAFLAARLPWVVAEGQSDEFIFWLMRRYRYRILYQSEKSDHPETQQITLLGVDR